MGSVVRLWILSCYAIIAKTNLGSPEEKDHRNGRQQAHEQGVFTPCSRAGPTTSSHSHNQEEDALCVQVLHLSCLEWRAGHILSRRAQAQAWWKKPLRGTARSEAVLNGSQ